MARRKLKTSKAEREANKRRRRWAWFHDTGNPCYVTKHVRRRVKPNVDSAICGYSGGEWRPTRAL